MKFIKYLTTIIAILLFVSCSTTKNSDIVKNFKYTLAEDEGYFGGYKLILYYADSPPSNISIPFSLITLNLDCHGHYEVTYAEISPYHSILQSIKKTKWEKINKDNLLLPVLDKFCTAYNKEIAISDKFSEEKAQRILFGNHIMNSSSYEKEMFNGEDKKIILWSAQLKSNNILSNNSLVITPQSDYEYIEDDKEKAIALFSVVLDKKNKFNLDEKSKRILKDLDKTENPTLPQSLLLGTFFTKKGNTWYLSNNKLVTLNGKKLSFDSNASKIESVQIGKEQHAFLLHSIPEKLYREDLIFFNLDKNKFNLLLNYKKFSFTDNLNSCYFDNMSNSNNLEENDDDRTYIDNDGDGDSNQGMSLVRSTIKFIPNDKNFYHLKIITTEKTRKSCQMQFEKTISEHDFEYISGKYVEINAPQSKI
ncbi:MAG: hypothetical protein V4591_00705 [Bdellovibrionota bacterium]